MDFMLFNKCFTWFEAPAKCVAEGGRAPGEEILAVDASSAVEHFRVSTRGVYLKQALLVFT